MRPLAAIRSLALALAVAVAVALVHPHIAAEDGPIAWVMPVADPIRAIETLVRPGGGGATASAAQRLMAVAGLALEGDPLEDGLDPRWAAMARSLIRPQGGTEDRIAAWWWMAYEGRTAEVAAAIATAPPDLRSRTDVVWVDRFIRRDWRETPSATAAEDIWAAWVRCAVAGSAPTPRRLAPVPGAVLARYAVQQLIQGHSSFRSQESAATLAAAQAEAAAVLVWAGRPVPADGVALPGALGAVAAAEPDGSALRLRCLSLQGRLWQAVYQRYACIAYTITDPEGAAAFAAPWITAAPDSLPALLMSGGSVRRDKAYADRLAAALERSLADAGAQDPLRLQGTAWRRLAEGKHGKAKALRDPLVRAWKAIIPDGGSAGAGCLMNAITGSMDRSPAFLKDASKADPWAGAMQARLIGTDANRLGKRLDHLLAKEPWHLAAIADVLWEMDLDKPTPTALAALRHVRDAEPGHLVLFNLGFVLKRMGRLDEAVAAHLAFLRDSSDFETVLVRMDLAEIFEDRGDPAAAERFAREAAETWKQDALEAYAAFLERRERWVEASRWWQASADRYGAPQARIAALAAGLHAGGMAATKARAALAATAYPLWAAQYQIQWAAFLIEGLAADGRCDEALRLARAVDRDSGNPQARRLCIRLALATGAIAEAEELLVPVLADVRARVNQSPASASELIALAQAVEAVTGRPLIVGEAIRACVTATAAAAATGPLTAYVDGWRALSREGEDAAVRRWQAVASGPESRWRACARASIAAVSAPSPALARCMARMGRGSEPR